MTDKGGMYYDPLTETEIAERKATIKDRLHYDPDGLYDDWRTEAHLIGTIEATQARLAQAQAGAAALREALERANKDRFKRIDEDAQTLLSNTSLAVARIMAVMEAAEEICNVAFELDGPPPSPAEPIIKLCKALKEQGD